jgi:alpha-D-ribose 1-methylphosphonate 5-triphosphate diphosphatase PhnM
MRFITLLVLIANFCKAQNLIINNVSVIPVSSNTIISNVNVYITNGIIEKIVPADTKLPFKEYKSVDGKGKFLMPGMVDMHAHFPEANSPINLQEYLKLNLAAGVTTLRSMRGNERQLAIRDEINKQTQIAPEIFVSYVFPDDDSLLTKDKISDMVFQAKIKKFDFVKYLGGLKSKNMAALSQACYEYKIPLAGHAYNNSLQESIENDFTSIEHYQSVLAAYQKDAVAFSKNIEQLKQKNIGICPTLSFYRIFSFAYTEDELNSRNGMDMMKPEVKAAWSKEYNEALTATKEQLKDEFANKLAMTGKKLDAFNTVLKLLADQNVLLLLSADESAFNVPGYSMAEEMKLYANAGLNNYQILKCATLNPALYFKNEKYYGSVEIGKKANLVLLNANPLEKIDNVKLVEGTVLNGKYFPLKESTSSKAK